MKKIDFLLFKALGYDPEWVDEDNFILYTNERGIIRFNKNGQPYTSELFSIQVGNELTEEILNSIHEYVEKQELKLKEIKVLLSKSDEEKKQIIIEHFEELFL